MNDSEHRPSSSIDSSPSAMSFFENRGLSIRPGSPRILEDRWAGASWSFIS